MDKLKPVGFQYKGGNGICYDTNDEAYQKALKEIGRETRDLYALPEGYAIVPVEKIKEAVFDGFMASGEGYNGEKCGRLDSEEQAREIADNWVKAKLKAAQEEG